MRERERERDRETETETETDRDLIFQIKTALRKLDPTAAAQHQLVSATHSNLRLADKKARLSAFSCYTTSTQFVSVSSLTRPQSGDIDSWTLPPGVKLNSN